MSPVTLTPLQTGYSRVFLIEWRARGDHEPEYIGCARAGGIDWSLGTITKIECPSDQVYNQFVERGKIKGEADRPSTDLVSRYAANIESELLRLARIGCSFDLQFHLAVCDDPLEFNDFEKIVIFEEADLTNYGADIMGALESGERNPVNETGEISAREVYEVLPLHFAEVAGSIVTNEVVDVVFCDRVSCGECEDVSDGCQKIYAVTLSAGGSPGTPADVVYSLEGGKSDSWNTSEVDSLTATEDPTGIACVSGYVVVVSDDSCSLHYVDQDDLDAMGDETWVENATGFTAVGPAPGGCPMDIWSIGNYAFIAAGGGYVYGFSDPTVGVTVLTNGSVVGDNLRAIHALDRNICVAVGSAGAVIRTLNGGATWQAMSRPVGIGVDLHSVWVKSETEWWCGSSDGRLFYTLDGGVTWVTAQDWGGGAVYDIAFSTDSVMAVSHEHHQLAVLIGRIYRSYDGGHSFVLLPEGPEALPAAQRFTALALCEYDPNLVVGVGLDDGGTDGIIVLGED
jgi:hypothetical protein